MFLDNFVGQEEIIQDLKTRIRFVKKSEQPLPHMLLYAPPSMGKSLLVRLIAKELGTSVTKCNANREILIDDFAEILTHLDQNDLLHIDKIECLEDPLLSVIFSVLKDSSFQIEIGDEYKPIIPVKPFTLIGTTSNLLSMDEMLISRLALYEFQDYEDHHIATIISLIVREMGLMIETNAANFLATDANGIPGSAASIARKVCDYCKLLDQQTITGDMANRALFPVGQLSGESSSLEISEKLINMSGGEFEQFISKVFIRMGFDVNLIGSPGDHGIDLIVKRRDMTIAIQCKRWDDPVGESIIRDFYGSLMDSGIDQGSIFTTSNFTSPAREFVIGKPIKLINLSVLTKFVKDQQLL